MTGAGARAIRALEARQLNPEHVLAPGRFDAAALLVLSCLRRTFYPLMVAGLAFAAYADALDGEQLEITTPGETIRALLSPLFGIALAVLIRAAVGVLSLILAFPLSRWVTQDPQRRRRRDRLGAWTDRVFVSRAYRSLRWAGWTRNAALARVGPTGARIVWWFDLTMNVTLVVSIVALFAAFADGS